jgi:hypothetical protein
MLRVVTGSRAVAVDRGASSRVFGQSANACCWPSDYDGLKAWLDDRW